jgi:hypothetical protein
MEENRSLLDMGVDASAQNNLIETSRWSKLMAILILVAMGLSVLMLVFAWNSMAEIMMWGPDAQGAGAIVAVMLIIVIAIVAVLMSFLIKGANRIRAGIQNRDQVLFNNGLGNLKNFFVMYGVLAVLGMVFTLLGLVAS